MHGTKRKGGYNAVNCETVRRAISYHMRLATPCVGFRIISYETRHAVCGVPYHII